MSNLTLIRTDEVNHPVLKLDNVLCVSDSSSRVLVKVSPENRIEFAEDMTLDEAKTIILYMLGVRK